MTKSAKNANRTTKVTATIVTLEPLSKETKELEISYTRSYPKAIEAVKEALKLDDSALVAIEELINTPLKKKIYHAQSIRKYMRTDFETQEEAEENAIAHEYVIPYTMYNYEAQVWFYVESDNAYYTSPFVDDSPLKMTKVDARSFIKMCAEAYFEAQIIGIHDDKRYAVTRYALVNEKDLEFCEVKES